MTIYSLDVLLSLLGTSLLVHVQFYVLLLDLHTDFSGDSKVVWYSHLLKNFPQSVVTYAVKGFGRVNKADVFLELSRFFYDPRDVGNVPLPFPNPA